MVTIMKFIYIFTSIINVIGSIACAANAVQAYKRHNKYARNGWIVFTMGKFDTLLSTIEETFYGRKL